MSEMPTPWWKCTECGYLFQAPQPPEACPSCNTNVLHRRDLLHTRVWRSRVRKPRSPVGRGIVKDGRSSTPRCPG